MDSLPPPTGEPLTYPPPPAAAAPASAPASQEGPAAWQWWQGVLGVVTAVLGSGVAVAIVYGIAAAFGADTSDPPGGVAMLGLLVQNICFVGFVVLFAGMRGGRVAPWMLGLREPQPGWGMAIVWIIAAYATLIAAGALWSLVVSIPDAKVVDDLGVKASDGAAIAGAALICVAAPIAEELLFRGLLFRSLRNGIGTAAAVVVTGLAFGSVHVVGSPVEALPLLALFGSLLCLLYLKTRSLLPCMIVHSINNVITYGVLLDWGWQIPVLGICAIALILGAYRLVVVRFGPAPLHLSPV
jgi:membrane protease YdiL (CAAX protease family)